MPLPAPLRRRGPALGLFLVAAGCRVGPEYQPPEPELAARFDGAPPVDSESAAPEPVVDAWWRSFGDPTLQALIEEAFAANPDARSSLQRIRASRALRGIESSAYWPQIGAGAGYTWDRISENNPRFGPAVEQGLFPRDVESWDVGFDVAWELDLFGGVERRVESATASLQAEECERGALLLSIAAEVARSYFELRADQQRLAALEAQVVNERARGELLEQKRRAGILRADAGLQSRAVEETLRARRPALEAEIQSGVYRLAVLLGRQPQAGVPELGDARELPTARGQVPTGLPSELLLRRPDLLAAERRVAAASAEIGVATAELFPRFFLTGAPYLQAQDFGELFRSSSSAWVFGPSVSWSLFSGGRARAQVEAAEAWHEAALIEYEAAVLRALEEVEQSLVRYGKGVESLALLEEAAELRRRHTEVESLRRGGGFADGLDVLDSRAVALEAELRCVDQEELLLVQLVALYKALGGGWADAERSAGAAAEPGGGRS